MNLSVSKTGTPSEKKLDAQCLIRRVLEEGRQYFMENEAFALLSSYGIPGAKNRFVPLGEKISIAAADLRYPLVLKIVSPDIIHKSDVGGVCININGENELQSAQEDLLNEVSSKAPSAKIHGVLIAEQLSGVEVVIGGFRDEHFGPVLMFGLGGIFVEVLEDVVFRLIPIGMEDAQEMIEEVKGYHLLQGIRGLPPADIESLKGLIHRTSEIFIENPEIVEMDMNPVFAGPDGALIGDVRILVSR